MNQLALPAGSADVFFQADDKRFKKIVFWVLCFFIVLSIIIPYLPVFEIEREKKEKIPPRVAKVLMQKKQPKPKPKPPAKQPKAKSEKKDVPKPKEKPKAAKKTPKKEVKKKPIPKKKVEKKKTVKQRVEKVGLLALKSELTQIRNAPSVSRITNNNKKLIANANKQRKSDQPSLAKDYKKGSGGIDTRKLSKNITKTQLAERTLTEVNSNIQIASNEKRVGDVRANVRTIEEIRLVLERHKGSFTTLYNRQLRKSPGLRGTVLFEITISPAGKVVSCKIIESELKSPKLERKFVTKLKSLRFEEKEVDVTVIKYPLDFFPS